MSLEDDLELSLIAQLEPDDPPAEPDDEGEDRKPWTPSDEGAADWAARKVGRARRLTAEAEAQADRQRAAIDDWLHRQRVAHDRDIEFFETSLGRWLAREIEADPDGKRSRPLPSGATVRRTGGAASLTVIDEAALVDWLADHAPTAVEARWHIDKAEVKRRFACAGDLLADVDTETGLVDVLAGARLERGPWRYTVDTDGGGS